MAARGLRRTFRRRDGGSAAIVGFIAAIGFLLMLMLYATPFFMGPSPEPLSAVQLSQTAEETLQVLVSGKGAPDAWATSAAGIDGVQRLGLLQDGTGGRIDPAKYAALTRGKLNGQSSTNGFIDYTEARDALGVPGYDFHLRVSPLFDATDGKFGVGHLNGIRVAYVGNGTTMSTSADAERAQLASLPFTVDAYDDSLASLRGGLLPRLGTSLAHIVLNPGAGSASFGLVEAGSYATLLPGESRLTRALAIRDDAGAPAYSARREMRTLLGSVDLSAGSATVSWSEAVRTGGDAKDYGWLEASPDGGRTWFPISISADTGASSTWTARSAAITPAACGPCMGAPGVLLALHWTADGTPAGGAGWIVDDVKVADGQGAVAAAWGFEEPSYDVVVIGSDADPGALRAFDTSTALATFVAHEGGHLVALGGQPDMTWLAPLFHYAQRDAAAGVGAPDPTHPLLSTPNELEWHDYPARGAWDFSTSPERELFVPIAMTGGQDLLAATPLGAFPAPNGTVVLAAYVPADMDPQEGAAFLANVITYSQFVPLYADLGPEIPNDVPIATSTRTVLLDRSADGSGDYVDMHLTLYLWRGHTSAKTTTDAPIDATPSAPRHPSATGASGYVTLSWTPPLSWGSGPAVGYSIYRGGAPGMETFLATIGVNDTTIFVDRNVTDGVAYFYNVTASNSIGPSSSTPDVSAVPGLGPGAPALSAAPGFGQIPLSWTPPATTGGSAITDYRIYRGAHSGALTLLATIGANTTYVDAGLANGATWYYQVAGVNAGGEGVRSNEASATTYAPPGAPAAPTVASGLRQLTVSWAPPAANGGLAIDRYELWAGSAPGAETLLYTTPTANTTFVENGLGNNVTRYYQVIAHNALGNGPRSPEGSGTTVGVTSAPLALAATGWIQQINLSWSAPALTYGSNVTSYNIYVGTSPGSETYLASTGTNRTFVHMGLPSGALRYYIVTAMNAAGESPPSNEASATTVPPPGPPTGLVATGGSQKINLSWNAPTSTSGLPLTGYKVYRGNASGAETYLATIGTNRTYSDAGLANNTTRWYKVTALTAAGEGAYSNEASNTTFPSPVFTILPSGGVVPLKDENVTLRVLGTQITYGPGGPKVPVTVAWTQNGGTTVTPLFGNLPVKQGDNATFAVKNGTVLGARGDAKYATFHAMYSSWIADAHVAVLKDGDKAPNVTAFDGQTAVATYLAPYVKNGTISLSKTQVIVLYEFNPSLSSTAADYQDLVLLMDFFG